MLAACGGGAAVEETPADTAAREAIFEAVTGELGRPYRWGGEDPDGFDCSGLVQFSYGEAGIPVARTATDLEHQSRHIPLNQARPGDVLFYEFNQGLHVAIYIGDGRMVHAPRTGETVKISRVDQPPWPDRFVAAGRLLPRR
jgi:cell wall-associated NlpC family hydrolase